MITKAGRKYLEKQIKRAKEQRNATTNNEDFDLWHGIMEQYQNKLRQETNK